MSIDYDYKETELEALSSRINKEFYSIQHRLDDVETRVCGTHDETIDSLNSIKSHFNEPFTKIEGICLFFASTGSSVIVSSESTILRVSGIIVFIVSALLWLYFFISDLKK